MESLNQGEINKLSPGDRAEYDARFKIGDIIAMRDNGWPWTVNEGLPDFVRIKITNIVVADVADYADRVVVGETMTRRRKYQVNPALIQSIIDAGGNGVLEIAGVGVLDGQLINHG